MKTLFLSINFCTSNSWTPPWRDKVRTLRRLTNAAIFVQHLISNLLFLQALVSWRVVSLQMKIYDHKQLASHLLKEIEGSQS